MQRKDGQTYAPVGKVQKVCKDGEFQVGVVGLDHGHIYGMCNGLFEAGATIRSVYDRDPKKVDDFCKSFPSAVVASDPSEIYSNEKVSLVATAAIPSERASVAKKALLSDKHVFSDKPGFTTFDQLEEIRALVNRTQKRYGIYFSERLHVEAATYADALI
ncbi:MAG: gfo/Idh/MocA family oxidoreductase, partial [Spirochaetia bacterium]|nr:gfo/Idh/MocA family oxidoreductase [Spirochaetia bacterium]